MLPEIISGNRLVKLVIVMISKYPAKRYYGLDLPCDRLSMAF